MTEPAADVGVRRDIDWLPIRVQRDCACGGVIEVEEPMTDQRITSAVQEHQVSAGHWSWVHAGGVEAMAPRTAIRVPAAAKLRRTG